MTREGSGKCERASCHDDTAGRGLARRAGCAGKAATSGGKDLLAAIVRPVVIAIGATAAATTTGVVVIRAAAVATDAIIAFDVTVRRGARVFGVHVAHGHDHAVVDAAIAQV